MSKIEKQLSEATTLTKKRGESADDFATRLVRAISELDDAGWEALSPEAQNWFNEAADAVNKKQAPPAFPDAEPAAEETKPVTRRGQAATPAAPAVPNDPVVGDEVTITTKRGKILTGVIIESDDELVVIKDEAGEEIEVNHTSIVTMVGKPKAEAPAKASRRRAAEDDEPTPLAIEVGCSLTVVTARDKTITGKLIAIEDGLLIIDDGEGELEVNPEKTKSITITAAAPAAAATSAKATRGKKEEPPQSADKKKISSKDNGGVSATGRMREIICGDPTITKEAVAKMVSGEGLQFRDNTLDLVYADTQKIIGLLRALKKLK